MSVCATLPHLPYHKPRPVPRITSCAPTALAEIARVLGCSLPRDALALCVQLCEAGVSPDALAAVVRDIQAATSTAPGSTTTLPP